MSLALSGADAAHLVAAAAWSRPGWGKPQDVMGASRIPLVGLRSVPFLQGLTERSEDMMAIDSQAEIAASVAALQDLGPGYDQALAEGLVERIGADIDKRIAAEIDNRITAEVDSRILTQLDRYAGCRHQRRRARRMIRAERRMTRPNGPTAPAGSPSCWPSGPCWSPCR